MPYDVDNPPEKLRGHPEKTQRQWVHVYDSCMSKYGDDTKCQKMSWGVTGGWKKEKGFDPLDPDRDILIEIEVLSEMRDEELDNLFHESLKQQVTEKEIGSILVSDKLGFSVDIEEDEK